MNEAIVIDAPTIKPKDLQELFREMGFDCSLQIGDFALGKLDDFGDDRFDVTQEEL